ncbi:MAG: metalloregulator ArsR/SmtB family transcription factor [Spirochaetia bacterium]
MDDLTDTIKTTDMKKQERILKVLAVETRIRIVYLLKKGPLCVNALAFRIGISQGAVSQHLRVMRDAGLVLPEKRGYYVHYRLNETTFAEWRKLIDSFFDPDRALEADDIEHTPHCSST